METIYLKAKNGAVEKREFNPSRIKAEHITGIEGKELATEEEFDAYRASVRASTELIEINIPSSFLMPESIGGQGNQQLISLAGTASSMGAEISTHVSKGEGVTCFKVQAAFIESLPAQVREILKQFI